MKLFLSLTILLSFSAQAATEFYAKNQNQECTIAQNKVTKKVALLKGAAGFTTTTTISSFGIEDLAKKAAEASSGRTLMDGYVFSATIDGETSNLHYSDSKEAAALIQFIRTACF